MGEWRWDRQRQAKRAEGGAQQGSGQDDGHLGRTQGSPSLGTPSPAAITEGRSLGAALSNEKVSMKRGFGQSLGG